MRLALNMDVRCIWNILFLELLYTHGFLQRSLLTVINIVISYLRDIT